MTFKVYHSIQSFSSDNITNIAAIYRGNLALSAFSASITRFNAPISAKPPLSFVYILQISLCAIDFLHYYLYNRLRYIYFRYKYVIKGISNQGNGNNLWRS